ncbi:MAG TPA: hypothetical protein VFG04_14145 [Planctomycetaceae bacterium]|nr:hypothetical protein [Planctomycetaceae bacterium]
MKWLDSSTVKLLNLLASIVTLLGVAGGGTVGVHFLGQTLGNPAAASIGGFIGLIGMTLFIFAVWKGIIAMMHTCPICGGGGTIYSGSRICTKCNGNGRIFLP